jgi:hypothetical protein
MSKFWETSPEWQRRQELFAELQAAKEAENRAGELILSAIRIDADSPHGSLWQERRQAYMDASDRRDEVFAAWSAARKAFEASPAGQVEARYFARLSVDPIARASSPAVEEVA